MRKFDLFAARDGDVFRDSCVCRTDEAALRWAAARIIAEFELIDTPVDFDEVRGECDGVLVDSPSDPTEELIRDWSLSQVGMLSAFSAYLGPRFKDQRDRCALALIELAQAVDGNAGAP